MSRQVSQDSPTEDQEKPSEHYYVIGRGPLCRARPPSDKPLEKHKRYAQDQQRIVVECRLDAEMKYVMECSLASTAWTEKSGERAEGASQEATLFRIKQE